MTITYQRTGDRQYDVYQGEQRIGCVHYYDGDRHWKSRVSRGRRSYRGNGWVWGTGTMPQGYTYTHATRRQATLALLNEQEQPR